MSEAALKTHFCANPINTAVGIVELYLSRRLASLKVAVTTAVFGLNSGREFELRARHRGESAQGIDAAQSAERFPHPWIAGLPGRINSGRKICTMFLGR
jgi:hypothetical protein